MIDLVSRMKRACQLGLASLAGLLCCLIPVGLQAQTPAELLPLVEEYPEDKAVMLQKTEALNISLKNGELVVVADLVEDKYLTSDKAQGYANDAIHFNETFNEISNISATAFYPKGKKFKGEKVTQMETKSSLDGSVFYDDNRYIEIIFPKMDKGTRARVAYRETISDPHFLGKFYFQTFIPARKLQYSVTFPASVKVGYKVFNNEENQIKFAKTEEKGKTTYTWTATMADKYEYDDDGPSISYYVPHVALFVQEYTANGETVRVLDKVEDLYAWYQSLIGDLNQDKDPTINALVDSLTAGLTNDEEKVKRIYYWVQDNIKYVAFEDGMSGFIPRPAAKVCTKRYGDCKDMSSILTEMLEAAEIPSSLVWIGSRDIPYTYDDLPTPSVDNHMIAMVELNGKVIFLDATSQHTPIGMPSSFIQGKQALVSKTKENYDLLMVPVVEKETNYQRDSAFVKVDGNQLSGQGTAAFGGYVNVMVRERLNNRKTDKKKDYIERLLEKGHNKFRLAEYEAEGETNKDNDLVIDYQFEVPDYAQQVNNAIYVNLNLDKSYLNDFIEVEDRKVALEIDYKFQDEFTTVFEIPEGYSLDYLPESSSYEGDNFGFTIEYRRQGNQVQMSKTFYINTLLIDTDEFEAWNSMVKTLSSAYNESIVLKK